MRFLGGTLWTDFRLFNPHEDAFEQLRLDALALIKDYAPGQIRLQATLAASGRTGGYLTPEATISRHLSSRAWLESKLAKGDLDRTVVVTHHCPAIQSIPPQFRTGDASKFSPVYASNLTHLGGRAALWIHGHVHESCDYDLQGTRVVCNPMGYCAKELGPQNPAFTDLLIDV